MKTIVEMIESRKQELGLVRKLDQIKQNLEKSGFMWSETAKRYHSPAEGLGFFFSVTVGNPVIIRHDTQIWDRDKQSWEWACDNGEEITLTFDPQIDGPEEIIEKIMAELERVIGRAPWIN